MTELQLDLDNYRIPTRRDDEAAALDYLFVEEDAIGSAREILRDGYFDNEVPIVMKAAGGYIVLEGNRRVSALKALKDPTLVPAHETEVRKLLTRYREEASNLPANIRVMVADDRESAAPRIARLHSGLSKKGWSRDQQANYYYRLLGPGTTVDDVKRQHGGQSVTRYMKMAVMRRMLAGVKFKDKSLHEYVIGPKLTMSSFEYAFGKKDIAEAIGAKFAKSGLLEPESETPEHIGATLSETHRKAIEYLIGKFRAKELNTRSPELKKVSPEHDALIARLLGVTIPDEPEPTPEPDDGDGENGGADDGWESNNEDPSDSGHSAGTGQTGDGASGSGEDSEPQGRGTRGPNDSNTKDFLQFGGLDYSTHTSVNLESRYIELRRMKITVVPAATAMLLRSVLETTIKFHFEGTATPASGQLTPVVGVLDAAYGRERALRSQIGQIKSGSDTLPGSVLWFNLVCHSADTAVTPEQVRQAWTLLNPVLRRLLLPAASASV